MVALQNESDMQNKQCLFIHTDIPVIKEKICGVKCIVEYFTYNLLYEKRAIATMYALPAAQIFSKIKNSPGEIKVV